MNNSQEGRPCGRPSFLFVKFCHFSGGVLGNSFKDNRTKNLNIPAVGGCAIIDFSDADVTETFPVGAIPCGCPIEVCYAFVKLCQKCHHLILHPLIAQMTQINYNLSGIIIKKNPRHPRLKS